MTGLCRLWIVGLLLVASGAALRALAGAGEGGASVLRDSPADWAAWWTATHGELDASAPSVQRALAVFERVAAASGVPPSRSARLVVVEGRPTPLAVALPDGAVVVNRAALELCHGGVSVDVGDARFAFLVGHELAHLVRDDVWDPQAFSAEVDSQRSGGEPAAEASRRAEIRADGWGLISMVAAGYSASALLADSDFFEAWSDRRFLVDSHPDPDTRLAFLRSNLRSVRAEVAVFETGHRLAELGRVELALPALERFRDRFPSREVFNALGRVHLGVGRAASRACDPNGLGRYLFPSQGDIRSRASSPGPRSLVRGECAQAAEALARAAEALEKAVDLDPAYGSARIHLATVRLLQDRPSDALAVVDPLVDAEPGGREARWLKAIALHRFGAAEGLDVGATVLRLLDGEDGATRLARAAVLEDLGRLDEARRERRAVRDRPRDRLEARLAGRGRESGERPPPASSTIALPEPPLPLGQPLPPGLRAAPGRLDMAWGTSRAAIVETDRLRVLEVDGAVTLVEEVLPAGDDARDALFEGLVAAELPDRCLPRVDGELCRWGDLAIELRNGKPLRALWILDDEPPATSAER